MSVAVVIASIAATKATFVPHDGRKALTLGSTLIDLALVGGKLALGLLTGSLALISDAVHSGLDTAASILAFIAVRTAAQPADREHARGHGKAENLAVYTEGILKAQPALTILTALSTTR